ncbi:MAG: NTP transferase domain-containing protein [Propionibacteriales bacterium]|nr:NTP transferase domain-containing protein [Propionibacteriales bacterium]
MGIQIAILAAGLGTRLGKSFPKPLTELSNGTTIMQQQLDNLRGVFGDQADITVVVGFKLGLVLEAAPSVRYAYNELFDQTNTSKSLLKVLRLTGPGGLLWMNGDIVFDAELLRKARRTIEQDRSFVCVNTAPVADEEVKYTLDDAGNVAALSKEVVGGLGEAVGINYVSAADKAALITRLDECDPQDFFERGIELAILKDGQRWAAVDISEYRCVEVDFDDDLDLVNSLLRDEESRGL